MHDEYLAHMMPWISETQKKRLEDAKLALEQMVKDGAMLEVRFPKEEFDQYMREKDIAKQRRRF